MKKLLCSLFVAGLLSGVVGCGGSPTSTKPAPPPAAGGGDKEKKVEAAQKAYDAAVATQKGLKADASKEEKDKAEKAVEEAKKALDEAKK